MRGQKTDSPVSQLLKYLLWPRNLTKAEKNYTFIPGAPGDEKNLQLRGCNIIFLRTNRGSKVNIFEKKSAYFSRLVWFCHRTLYRKRWTREPAWFLSAGEDESKQRINGKKSWKCESILTEEKKCHSSRKVDEGKKSHPAGAPETNLTFLLA